ncbi:hypothetical protein D2E26_1397 [Bifidobacterium dolichotidis]|uniref:YitT family protein n=1 Tax=Bifidobacterium dolichotidis TaxID=2306976 RepID=A0A430FKB2_9BIFI|nr:DUF6198 family protein [Bifidobacterium dolichotidis]RSX53355.1 hypothetical protein D2E26_1397 [Bifidobacterium dolichotidis]
MPHISPTHHHHHAITKLAARAWHAHIPVRTFVMFFGMALMALGVSLSIKGDLGTSPISSLPYALSCILGPSVGTMTIILNVSYVLIQVLILRRNTRWNHWAQLIMATSMGVFIDFFDWILPFGTPSSYFMRWVLCILGIIACGVGIAFEVRADLILNAGEGMVATLAEVMGHKFGNVKIVFDSTCVALALASSLLCLGAPAGVREGTVAAALCVGLVVKASTKVIHGIDVKRWALATAH